MKNIQIVGMGCPKCVHLFEQTETAAKELGIDYKIEKISDLQAITNMGIMTTPALVVDGTVKSAGKVPSKEIIKTYLV
jgi:small redox-active disulfide protein 2